MKILKKVYHVLTDVWITRDNDGNTHVYPYLVGILKFKMWQAKRKALT